MRDPRLGTVWAQPLMEAYAFLVGVPVFNTGVARYPGQAGSIPVRLRRPAAMLRRGPLPGEPP